MGGARGDIATITGHKANVNRKKLCYGACVDEPVCMIDVAANNAVYYYHFDGVGSVVALSGSNGDSVQSYEYSIYGQVAAEDPNHPNPYMFTGRRFDIETGLYYYRARYYNPHIGRFMQTDPVGYDDGINWYLYCGNNPGRVDPSGLSCWEDFWDAKRDLIEDTLESWEDLDLDDKDYREKFWEINDDYLDALETLLDELEQCIENEDNDPCVLECPETEKGAKANKGLCHDTLFGGAAHRGQSCYREVIPLDSEKGDTMGLHCCYDDESGTLDVDDSHIDAISPAIGGGGGTCVYDRGRAARHLWWEFIVPNTWWYKMPWPGD